MKIKTFLLPTALLAAVQLVQSCQPAQKQQSNTGNRVTWFSIPSDDVERATKFYKVAFGWQQQPIAKEKNPVFDYYVMTNSPGDENYTPHQKGMINGCIVKREIGLPTPAVLVEVDNLANAVERVKRAGGEVVTDTLYMESLNGKFVLIKDTEGNYVEVFQNIAP